MTVRELRASWRRLAFFFICIAIGVGAIVALRSVIESVRGSFAGEARALMGGDAALIQAETNLELTHGKDAEVLVFDLAS